MDLTLGPHALLRMDGREITIDEVAAIVAAPRRVEQSRGLTRRYFGEIDGRGLIVVLAHDVEPPYVVTVMIDYIVD